MYAPLRLKTARYDRWFWFFAIVHLWSIFIAEEHFADWHGLRALNCAVFSYWLQIFVGMQGVLMTLLLRLSVYARFFHPAMQQWPVRGFRLFWALPCALMACALGAICIIATPHAQMNDAGHCETPVAYKIPLVVWTGIMLTCLGGATFVLRDNRHAFHENRDTVGCGLIGFAVITGIHFSGVSAVASILAYSILYLIISLRLYAQRVIWVVCGDRKKAAEVMASDDGYAMDGACALYFHHRQNYARILAFCDFLGSLGGAKGMLDGEEFDSMAMRDCLRFLCQSLREGGILNASVLMRHFVGPRASRPIKVRGWDAYPEDLSNEDLERLYDDVLLVATTIWGHRYEQEVGTGISHVGGYTHMPCGTVDLDEVDASNAMDAELKERKERTGDSASDSDRYSESGTDGSELSSDKDDDRVVVYASTADLGKRGGARAYSSSSNSASGSDDSNDEIIYANVKTLLGRDS